MEKELWDILIKSDAPVIAVVAIYFYRQMKYWRNEARTRAEEFGAFKTEQLKKWQGMYDAIQSAYRLRAKSPPKRSSPKSDP